MIQVTPTIAIDESTVQLEFVRSSGPGGQNVNKVSSAVVLRFNATNSGLPFEVLKRLVQLAGKRMTEDGILIIKGQQHRTQERNREDVLERLTALIREAANIPKTRKATKPTRASKIRTLEAKQHRSQIKRARKVTPQSDE